MTKKYNISILTLFLVSGICFGQKVNNTQNKFVRVYSILSCPTPPFAKKKIELSNYQICFRNVLPLRSQINESFLDKYDSCDTIPKYRKVEATDYDSIVNFILNSDLLNIDLNYIKPDTTGGVICFISGACGYQYVIETSEKNIVLQISGSTEFKLPEILMHFDNLFKRVTSRNSVRL